MLLKIFEMFNNDVECRIFSRQRYLRQIRMDPDPIKIQSLCKFC
jgi:hypothetical protein